MRVFYALLIGAGVVYAIALLSAAMVGGEAGGGRAKPQAAEERSAAIPQVVGMSINVYHAADMAIYRDAIDGIADLGCNAVQVVTPMFVRDGVADRVEIVVGPSRGPERGELVALLRHAELRGLRASLMPQVNLYAPRGNEWRGKISPHDWNAWWASYREALLHFLEIAREGEAEMFVVGCELLTTQTPEHERRWRELIAECRARFGGRLTYSTNWDRYDRVLFWDALDAVGISGYWDLTGGNAEATDDHLAARWREIRSTVVAFAEAKGRPALFTEIGYPSLPWAVKDPWNYVGDVPADFEAQARGYRAFLAAWSDRIDGRHVDAQVAGVFFYKWDVYGDGGVKDTGYGVRGKPAYEMLRAWIAR